MSNPHSTKIPSTSDQRTSNNTVRHQYRTLSEEEKTKMLTIKDKGLELIEYIDDNVPGREGALAKTRIEEAVMWAVKGITA